MLFSIFYIFSSLWNMTPSPPFVIEECSSLQLLHNISWLKTIHTVSQESGQDLTASSTFKSLTRLQSRCQPKLGSPLRLDWGGICFWVHMVVGGTQILAGCWTEGLNSPGSLSTSGCPQFLAGWASPCGS